MSCGWSHTIGKGMQSYCDTPGEHCAPCHAERDEWMTYTDGIVKDIQVGYRAWAAPHLLEIDSDGTAWLEPYGTVISKHPVKDATSPKNRYLHIERTRAGFWITSDPLEREFEQPVQLRPRPWQRRDEGLDLNHPKRFIRDMQVGESGYEVPWALEITPQLRGVLNPHFDISPSVMGTISMKITRTEKGFRLEPPSPRGNSSDYKWRVKGSIKGDIEIDASMMPRVATLKPCSCRECNPRRSIRDMDIGEIGWIDPTRSLSQGHLNPHHVVANHMVGSFGMKVTRLDECFWLDNVPRDVSHKARLTVCSCKDCKDAPVVVKASTVDYMINSMTTPTSPPEPAIAPKPKPAQLADYLNDEDKEFFKFTDKLAGIGQELVPVAEFEIVEAKKARVRRRVPPVLYSGHAFVVYAFFLILAWTLIFWTFLAPQIGAPPAPVLPAANTMCSTLQPYAEITPTTAQEQHYQDEYRILCK